LHILGTIRIMEVISGDVGKDRVTRRVQVNGNGVTISL
jgi:hypothetical protein